MPVSVTGIADDDVEGLDNVVGCYGQIWDDSIDDGVDDYVDDVVVDDAGSDDPETWYRELIYTE